MRDLTVLFLLALCLAPEAFQGQTAARADVLTGRVTDLTGKPVADAQVGATSLGSGLTRSYTTDIEGRYKIFFPETASRYELQVKRMGFSPVKRTITRRTKDPEQMTIDMQLGAAPLALSMVESARRAVTGTLPVPMSFCAIVIPCATSASRRTTGARCSCGSVRGRARCG